MTSRIIASLCVTWQKLRAVRLFLRRNRNSIDLVHKLNMKVVAEGVETQAVFDIVQQPGCDVAQGYLISRPLAIANFAQWHNNWS